MGNVIIQNRTTLDPISLIGEEAGICWGSDIYDPAKNYKRGLDCIISNHGRTLEFPQVYLTIEGYSARVIRELYTHIAGGPTRLQESTRYIDYTDFSDNKKYVTPKSVSSNKDANAAWDSCMCMISYTMKVLEDLDIPREDIGMLLPLAMHSKIVFRTNLRHLVDMSHQRLCSRANWEYRDLMKNIIKSLSEYSEEWNDLVERDIFVPKCEYLGKCPEKKSCGRFMNK